MVRVAEGHLLVGGEDKISRSVSDKVVRNLAFSVFSLGGVTKGSYWKILKHQTGVMGSKSQFSAAYKSREKIFHLVASVIALPNFANLRGTKLFYVGVFNHIIGWVETKLGTWSSNCLVVVVDARSNRVITSYPFLFFHGKLP